MKNRQASIQERIEGIRWIALIIVIAVALFSYYYVFCTGQKYGAAHPNFNLQQGLVYSDPLDVEIRSIDL